MKFPNYLHTRVINFNYSADKWRKRGDHHYQIIMTMCIQKSYVMYDCPRPSWYIVLRGSKWDICKSLRLRFYFLWFFGSYGSQIIQPSLSSSHKSWHFIYLLVSKVMLSTYLANEVFDIFHIYILSKNFPDSGKFRRSFKYLQRR